jgi:hypothetical protein
MDVERLSIVRFEEELRHAARGRLPLVGNLLDAAVKKIEQNPALAQCRLLTRSEKRAQRGHSEPVH